MKMNFNPKKDWWLANSVFWIISGLFTLIVRAIDGSMLSGLLSGGLNILVGAALLQRSKIVFWVTLVLAAYTFIMQISSLSKASQGTSIYWFPFGFVTIQLVLALMLWQQIRIENKKAKV